MKIRTLMEFVAQSGKGSLGISKRTGVVLYALACLFVPVLLSASPADAPKETAAMPRESGPDYSAGKLVGTMRSGGLSGAVFENASGEQNFYRKGVTFSDGSRIVAVYSESIVVRTKEGTSLEYLVTRGTAGKSGTAPVSRPAVEPPSYSGSQDKEEGEISRTLRGKRRHRGNTGENEQ